MKLLRPSCPARSQSGLLLTECLVYIAVFAILLGGGTAAFYFCWDHTRSVVFATSQIESALRAGERWRADVRAATAPLSVTATPAGETVKIVTREKDIVYRLTDGALRREIAAQNLSQLLLEQVKSSAMQAEPRDGVTACKWELELTPLRKETQLPLRFTFEAAPAKP